MLTALSRFLGNSRQQSELLEKAKEHIAYSFESLLELEPNAQVRICKEDSARQYEYELPRREAGDQVAAVLRRRLLHSTREDWRGEWVLLSKCVYP